MKNIRYIFLVAAITLLKINPSIYAQDYVVKTVVIDAGHGGKDPGTHGKYTNEKDIALKVALKVGQYIEEHIEGVKVIYTRKTDVFVELMDRAKIANDNNADLFISIHCNALGKSTVKGTETYVMAVKNTDRNFEVAKRENSVILLEDNYEENYQGLDLEKPESYILFSLTQSAYQASSILFADKVEEQLGKRAGRKSLGVKQSSLYVLWNTAMPSALIEIGYLTNPGEEKELNDEKIQDYIASAIFRAFRDYKTEVESLN